jgi:hypothetical protein
MPVGGSRFNKKFGAKISGDELAISRTGFLLRSIARAMARGYGDTAAVVSDAISSIAAYLIYFGISRYEILPASKNKVKGYFALKPFPSKTIFRVPFGFVQLVLRSVAPTQQDSRYRWLNAKDAWAVQMPVKLVSVRRYKHFQHKLKEFRSIPAFHENDLTKGKWAPNFDFAAFKKVNRNALLQLTRVWGWNGRDLSLEFETEIYIMFRAIKFRWALAVMRDHILQQLNTLLVRLAIPASISIEGLISPDEYLRIQAQALAAEISFEEALSRME